jgi:hypothetical protein
LGRRLLALACVVAASSGAFVVACDLEVDTKYGPHSGLSKNNLPTAPPSEAGVSADGGLACGTPVDAGACTVSYANDIWPKMQGTWHCSDAKCHGGTSYSPQLDSADNAYTNMMNYKVGSTKPYINPCSTDPDASAFVCNVSNPACGAAQMPFPDNTLGSGPMSGADLTLVTTWVQCGAPKN